MNDAGMAAEQVQRFLSTMNLPWLSQKVIADRQKEQGRPIDSIVSSSLDDSLEEEKTTVKENMPTYVTVDSVYNNVDTCVHFHLTP